MVKRLLLVVLVVAAAVTVGAAVSPHQQTEVGAARTEAITPVAEPPAETGNGDVAHLDRSLQRSFEAAQAAAAAQGVALRVNSGWRSVEYQAKLYAEALKKYGSAAEARKWVLPPDESNHVKGTAIDVGPPAAAQWLKANGERFGLCQRYANEPWHFERLAGAKSSTCPPMEPHA